MNYYHCSTEDLHLEYYRRGYNPVGTRDQLSEALQKDDHARGTDATTVTMHSLRPYMPRESNTSRTAEFGQTAPAMLLVNEKIIYWAMNTFFPTLQLFFESGLSCTIDGGRLPDAVVGLDPVLRFRLTDCTYEEEGCIVKTMRPDKFAQPELGIVIKEVVIAQRISVAVTKATFGTGEILGPSAGATVAHETHTVVGLRLEGMTTMAYIWAQVQAASGRNDKTWGDVRLAGLRKDVPVPNVGFPMHVIKPGGEMKVVAKESQASKSGRWCKDFMIR